MKKFEKIASFYTKIEAFERVKNNMQILESININDVLIYTWIAYRRLVWMEIEKNYGFSDWIYWWIIYRLN